MSSTSLAEKLQKLQNRAARILLSAPYDSSALDLFRRLHWKNLRNQRLFAKAVMMFKILNGQTPDYLSNKFIFRNDTTSYRLRNSEMRLALPQPRTDYVRKSFSYSGAALCVGKAHFSSDPKPAMSMSINQQMRYQEKYPHIAPEIVNGSGRQSAQSDICSLGKISLAVLDLLPTATAKSLKVARTALCEEPAVTHKLFRWVTSILTCLLRLFLLRNEHLLSVPN